jgi:hypothetical protein
LTFDPERWRKEEPTALDGYTRLIQWVDATYGRYARWRSHGKPITRTPSWLTWLRGWLFILRRQAGMPVPEAIRSWESSAVALRRAKAGPYWSRVPPSISRASAACEDCEGERQWDLDFYKLDNIGACIVEIHDASRKLVRFELRNAFEPENVLRALSEPQLVHRSSGRDYEEVYRGMRASDRKEVTWRLQFFL